MVKKMVFTSAGDNTNFDELWINCNQTYDIYVIYFGDDEAVFEKYKSKVHYAEQRKGSKFQNFFYFYKKFRDVIMSYDYIFILDDDIIITSQDIESMFTIAEKYYLLICQPSFTNQSQISHLITKHIPTVFLQYTNFVEVNAPLFKRDALDRLMNKYDEKLIGWGIDYLSIYENGITLTNKYAIIHEIQCINPRISDKKYKRKELEFVDNCDKRQQIWLDFAEQNNYRPRYELKSYDTIYSNSYDIWVINLYNKHDRWKSFSGLNVNRFNATDGYNINIYDASKDGVSPLIMLKTDSTRDVYYNKRQIENNEGKVGCWLSHKRLLRHLLTLECSDSDIHLILEDDVCLDDLYKWRNLYPTIPNDWDLVYAGIKEPILTNPVCDQVYRAVSAHPSKKNFGTHAYFVKHSSIPSLLKHLEFMTHEIDVQLDIIFSKMNMYIINPPIVTLNDNSRTSSIEKHNAYTTWEIFLLSIIETPLKKIKFDSIADLECFARIFAGTSPWLSLNNDKLQILSKFDQLVLADNVFTKEQSIVECAYICYGFLITKNVLWKKLTENTRLQFVTILRSVRKLMKHYHTKYNWYLFHGIIEAFLKSINQVYDDVLIGNMADAVEKWYCGDGFYKDGEKGFRMDYYNSYVIHPFYIEILKVYNPTMVEKAFERCIRYTEFLERIVSPDGSYPPLGRSITYRFGAFHALSYCIYNQRISTQHTYPQIERLLTNVLKRIITSSIFNADGILELGFTGSQPEIADSYSTWGSCYLTTLGFLPLGLDKTHEFWLESSQLYSQELAWVHNMPFKKYIIQ